MNKRLSAIITLIMAGILFCFTTASAQTILSDSTAADGTRIVQFQPKGVCSTNIEIHTLKNRITLVQYTRGCDGNLKAIGILVKGMEVKDAIKKLEGVKCGKKETSCSDQLTIALKMMQETKKKK